MIEHDETIYPQWEIRERVCIRCGTEMPRCADNYCQTCSDKPDFFELEQTIINGIKNCAICKAPRKNLRTCEKCWKQYGGVVCAEIENLALAYWVAATQLPAGPLKNLQEQGARLNKYRRAIERIKQHDRQ